MFKKTPLALALATVLLPYTPTVVAADKELAEITVSGGASGGRSKFQGGQSLLRDEIIATESMSSREIEKAGATMLTEVLDKKPGVAMQAECSICSVRNIVLNNLPGRFTTLMIDGIPIFSSVSSAYGLDSVSLGGIERIDISRGAGASLTAPEALSGAVNIVTRRPAAPELQFVQQLGSYGQRQTDLFAAQTNAANTAAFTVNYTNSRQNSIDRDGNQVSEYAGYTRELAGLGFFADDLGGFKVKGRLDKVNENRMGGALGKNYDAVKNDGSSSPFSWGSGVNASPYADGWVNPSTGAKMPYSNGLAGMSEIIFTDRTQFVSSATRSLGAGTLRLAMGYAKHKQDSFYEKSVYKAEQSQYYWEASTQQPLGQALITAGFSYRYEDLSSKGQSSTGVANDGIDNYAYRTPGIFLQAYRTFFDDRLEANGALRIDKHNVFGTIASPRLNLQWTHDNALTSRFAVGKGFRAPTSFFEQDHGILDTTRVVRQVSQPEISHNASYSLAYASDRFAWRGGLHWNKIWSMAMLDSGALDSNGLPITLFTSSSAPVTVKGGDFSLTYKVLPSLEATLGLEKTHYDFIPGTLPFARPEEKVYLSFDYDQGPLDVVFRATWTGTQDLARFYNYANNPRYNLDGTPKMAKSPAFWVFDVRGEYKLSKQWSTFVGVDNLLDFRQTKKDGFLWLDSNGNLDVTQIWGPSRGRFIYGGVKFTL